MPYMELINEHYKDIGNLNTLLSSMVNSYRLLIGGAAELNNIEVVRKDKVKDAIERVDRLGDIIDDLIKTLECCSGSYYKYCQIKNQYVDLKTNKNIILTEIDFDLDFNNNQK